MNEKTKKALDKILQLFESGDVPQALSVTLLPRLDVPSSRWSITNRLIMYMNGTEDGRGYKQWQQVGRCVKPKSKAFYIICPLTVTKEKEGGEKETIVIGYRAAPVFRIEDTDGKEVKVEHLPPPQLPPLHEVAQSWGISVDWQGYPGASYGYYKPSTKEIVLATHDESIFFHELAHVSHEKVLGDLSKVEVWRKECVAELTASVLAHLYGKKPNVGRHYRYIQGYAEKAHLDAYHACIAVVSDVSKCLNLILEEKELVLKAA